MRLSPCHTRNIHDRTKMPSFDLAYWCPHLDICDGHVYHVYATSTSALRNFTDRDLSRMSIKISWRWKLLCYDAINKDNSARQTRSTTQARTIGCEMQKSTDTPTCATTTLLHAQHATVRLTSSLHEPSCEPAMCQRLCHTMPTLGTERRDGCSMLHWNLVRSGGCVLPLHARPLPQIGICERFRMPTQNSSGFLEKPSCDSNSC